MDAILGKEVICSGNEETPKSQGHKAYKVRTFHLQTVTLQMGLYIYDSKSLMSH